MFSSERRLLIVVGVLCFLLALMGYAWKHRTIVPYVTVPLERVTTPFAYGTSRFLDGIHTGIAVLDAAINGVKERDSLQEENAQLQQKLTNYDEMAAENMRLRQLLQFQTGHPQFDMVAAAVITRDFGTYTNTFTIDRGSAEGIQVNMAVVVPGGVVGFVSDVYDHSARVQTMLDPRTAIGVIVQRPESRVSSVVRGNGNVPTEPQFVNIAKDADILEGDTLVTSGFGSIYPKGLPIGTIVSIHQNENDFVKYAVIRPSVDFSKLEEVFVILKSADTGSYEKPEVTPKLVPQTNRDKVEGIKGAAAL